MIKDKIAKLIDLKSIVTILLIGLFCYSAIVNKVDGQTVKEVVMIVITFFFGSKTLDKKVD